jgi:hypothetical protein
MVEMKRTLKHVTGNESEYEIGVNMVSRIEVEPMDDHFILVTMHYWETPDAQEENQEPKVTKFAVRDDGAQALSKSLAESVAFNLAQDAINKASKRVH